MDNFFSKNKTLKRTKNILYHKIINGNNFFVRKNVIIVTYYSDNKKISLKNIKSIDPKNFDTIFFSCTKEIVFLKNTSFSPKIKHIDVSKCEKFTIYFFYYEYEENLNEI